MHALVVQWHEGREEDPDPGVAGSDLIDGKIEQRPNIPGGSPNTGMETRKLPSSVMNQTCKKLYQN